MNYFKKGDRVFDIRYGWGVINLDNGIYFNVEFNDVFNTFTYTHRDTNKLLSFTEYTLEGHSLEKPEVTWKSIYSEWSYDDSDLKYREFLEQNFEPPVRKCK
jgi:hypothetical protein